jgi:Tannase and feruloyl esterase
MSRKKCETIKQVAPLWGAAIAAALSASAPALAKGSLPQCASLSSLLLRNPDITAATSAIQPASSGSPAYCQATITVSALAGVKDGYLPGQKQQIGLQIALPLSSADGGKGGVQGAWNGRTESMGGAGFQGAFIAYPFSLPTVAAEGYVGSNTDTGHTSAVPISDDTWALNPDGTLNKGLLLDFGYRAVHEQAVWTKELASTYYGAQPKYSYFNGCSTGGRQGYAEAQAYPDDFDGILAGAPGINQDRVYPSYAWGEIEVNQEVGAPISSAKLTAVTQAAIAACAIDGIIQDPRACTFNAKQFVCKGSRSDPANCLTSQEANAVNKLWSGPTGTSPGSQLWFGSERGTNLNSAFANAAPDGTAVLRDWIFRKPSFNVLSLSEDGFRKAFLESELTLHPLMGGDDPDLSAFEKHGGKIVSYHGLADEVVFPRGTYNYYNRVSQLQGGITETQAFYRFFPVPGNSHCNAFPSNFPNAPLINFNDLFSSLVNWVEHGQAPDSIVAYNNLTPSLATVSRPLCKYPDKLVYNGQGSTAVASNFHCQVETSDPLMNAENALPDPAENLQYHGSWW